MSRRDPPRARSVAEPYRLGDVMQLAGYADEDSFRAWRLRAEAIGFPPPLPGCTRPLKWSRAQVDAWFAAGGRPAQAALGAQREAAPIDEIAAARARLRLKAQQR
ncbi:MAG: hypothetical protein BroJett013_30180 [Alphaproteobacteria bacterium]|nr:MAG: hypothetical protein BroJett013_30180 [Alphaproteobacteria bacterium]